jgi:hypothetical protein
MRLFLTVVFCFTTLSVSAGHWESLILTAISKEIEPTVQPAALPPLPTGPYAAPIPDEIRYLFDVAIPVAEDCPDGNCPVTSIGEAKRLPPLPQTKSRQSFIRRRLRK